MKIHPAWLMVAGVAGVLVHAAITHTLFGKDVQTQAPVQPVSTVNAIPIEHLPAGPMRFSVTKIEVYGRSTWILYDKEMGTEFIADADGILNWAATNPAGR